MWPIKRCTGAHCELREKCKHHALPTTDTKQLIYPVQTNEYCQWFEPKEKSWGEGKETNE